MNKKFDNKKAALKPKNKNSKPPLAKQTQRYKKIKQTSSFVGDVKYNFKKKPNQETEKSKISDEIRLNKYIANSGACSRRDADIYIKSGNVKVNGITIVKMGYLVKLTDLVNFDGNVITPEKKVYILLNKPKNFTTAVDESQEFRNVLELLKGSTTAKIGPVGRMDKNTTGLLLFTNDTNLIRKFSLTNQKSSKIYQVSLDRNLKFEDLEKISKGVVLDGHKLYIEEVSYIENEPKNEIGIKLNSANVKVVRTIFESFQYNVIKIDRVVFAGLTKKNLPRGNWRHLTSQEVINLINS